MTDPKVPPSRSTLVSRWLRELAFLATGILLSVLGLLALVGILVGGVTTVLWIGLPVLAATGAYVVWCAELERAACGRVLPDRAFPAHAYLPVTHMRDRFADAQVWRDAGHAVLGFPLRLLTGLVGLAWSLLAVGLTFFILWEWALPRGDVSGLFGLVTGDNSRLGEILVNTALGLVALALAPTIVHAMTMVRYAFARALLTTPGGALRARAEAAEAGKEAASRAESQTLRSLERNIHDGPQQQLVRLNMDLEAARRRLQADDPLAAATLIDEATVHSREVLTELRALSRGIAPPVLRERGLVAAVLAAAARCPVDTVLDTDIPTTQRLGRDVEAAAYFVVSEALTNVAKHSGASHASVQLAIRADVLHVRVEDDGRGGAHVGKGHGLAGIEERLAAADGTLEVRSPEGGPTVLTAVLHGATGDE